MWASKFMHILIWSLFFIYGLTTNLNAMMGGPPPQDPLERLNYRSAFNLDSVNKKFSSLMTEMGCDENVFGQKRIEIRPVETGNNTSSIRGRVISDNKGSGNGLEISLLHAHTNYDLERAENSDALVERIVDGTKKGLYEKACLDKLESERRSAILEPAREAGTIILLMGGAAAGIVTALGANSYGGSIGIFAVMFNSIWFVRDVIRSGYNLHYRPPHDLDGLEVKFSINQYIPRVLWPIIIEKFITARHNPFEHQSTVRYIDFSLGLTVYAPKLL